MNKQERPTEAGKQFWISDVIAAELYAEQPEKIPEVSPIWSRKYADQFQLVDVREAHEVKDPTYGLLDDALHVPLATVQAYFAEWDRDTPLVIYCRSGVRSLTAARALREIGFTNVASMFGGIIGWHATRHYDLELAS